MKTESKPIVLSEEIVVRSRLKTEFERLLSDLSSGGLSVTGPQDLNALAELLFGVVEERKRLEKEEKALKAEIKRHFPSGIDLLPLEGFMVFIERSSRSYLDRERILAEIGQTFIDKFSYATDIESLKVKRIGGAK